MFEDYIKEKGELFKNEIIDIRRIIHAHPEPSLNEFKTTKLICEKLKEYGIKYEVCPWKTGVVGLIPGNNNSQEKTVMLRADIDCLKITEKCDVPFKSENAGLMHACGHDAHTAWLIGAAHILSGLQGKLPGNIKLVFQPAEESSGGARMMIENGVLENPKVDAVFGAHIWPYVKSGIIATKKGGLMAASDNFVLTILGKGGHGGHPHKCNDPIASACEIYMAFQTIISRSMDPLEPAVLTIGKFTAGTAHNVIPDEVTIEGTVRTLTKDSRVKVKELMEHIIKGITSANGAKYDFKYTPYHPTVINNEELSSLVESTAVKVLGNENFLRLKRPTMAGEDFSFYQERVPGAFFYMGTLNDEIGANFPLHNSMFNIDENVLNKTSIILSQCAIDYLDLKSKN